MKHITIGRGKIGVELGKSAAVKDGQNAQQTNVLILTFAAKDGDITICLDEEAAKDVIVGIKALVEWDGRPR